MHPIIKKRLEEMDRTQGHPSRPGGHAEVHALNDALIARDKSRAEQGKPPVQEHELNTFTQQSVWTKDSQDGGMVKGDDAPRCGNCAQITKGVNNLSGDAPPQANTYGGS
jgi:hypothetical protein